MVSCMLSSTSSIALRTSSRIVAYWARRSTSGMSCVMTAVMSRRLLLRIRSRSHLLARGQVIEPGIRVRVDADETGEVAYVPLELHRRIAGPHGARRDAMADDAARADECVLADLDAREDRAVRADAC